MNEKKLNIGIFIDTFFPMIDGVISVVDNYAKRLKDRANVLVFAPKAHGNFDASSLPYKTTMCKSLKVFFLDYDLPTPDLDKNFKKTLKNANLDIIHIHSPFTIGKMAVKFARKHNIPVVATMHSQFEKDFMRATHSKALTKMLLHSIMKVFNDCDECWTMNKGCEELLRNYGYTGKVVIIPNGTDMTNNLTEAEINEFKKCTYEKLNIGADDKIFINIGRINRLKNLEFLLKVARALKDEGFKFKLILIGDGHDKKELENLKNQLNLENEVFFVGKITDLKEKCLYFSISDLHVFPSKYDTDGIVKIEAACFNVPTIFLENTLPTTNITDNVNGFIEKEDEKLFAERIIKIFEDSSLLNQVKINCKRDLYLTWDDIVNKVYGEYIRLTKEKL